MCAWSCSSLADNQRNIPAAIIKMPKTRSNTTRDTYAVETAPKIAPGTVAMPALTTGPSGAVLPGCGSRVIAIVQGAFLLLALISLSYATVTAFDKGSDLAMFQDMGRRWVDGVYQTEESRFYGHPPYASVLYSAMAFLSFEQLRAVFVLINLLTTFLILLLIHKLWGSNWSARTHWLLAAFLLSSAPFRVALRYGQISLILTALVLGSLLAWKKKRAGLAGLLIGLSLAKYSLTVTT